MPLKEGRFVDTLPFTTTRIRRLTAVATDLCLLERDENASLRIAGVMCGPGAERDTLSEVRHRCGPSLSIVPDLTRFDPPFEYELASLRRFDPQRAILA